MVPQEEAPVDIQTILSSLSASGRTGGRASTTARL
jgi:hypothetical protein